MAVLSRLDIEISANSARFQQEIQNVSTTSRRAAAQLQRDQQQQAQSRLQIERQYASEHRRIEMSLTDEVERIRAARFNTADEQRYLAQARERAQAQVDLIAQQERATTGFADKAKAAYGYVAIAVGVAGAAIGALVRNQIEMTAELTKTAYIANTTVENIQKYVVAAKGMGIETDKLGDIFKDTQDKVGDFLTTGGGEMADFFENIAPQVKVTADQFRNLSGPDALQLYFDSLQKANLSQSEMIFYMESVADEASALIPYLKDGGKGFDLWATAAENAGATMDEKTIRATQELKTSTELLNLSVQGAKNQIAQAFMPILRDLASELVKDAQFKNQAAAAGQAMAQGFKIIAMTGVGVVAIMSSIGKAIGGVLAAFAQFGRVAEGVDLTSPFAAFQIAKNVLWDIPTSQLTILKDTVVDVRDTLVGYDGLMTKINNLGTNVSGSNIVTQATNLTIQSEKLKNATGKTGKALKEETEAKKENAKATAKLANEQARLVGISGNSGIGSGAHLDIRASGGGRRLTSAELARFQADGKPLTAYRKTSDYGYRGDIGVAGASKYHRGIDFAMPVGTPITTKVAIKDIKSFYDSKGGGYVQRILFADGLSVDLLHQSPASKGIKGGSSGIKSPYTRAQDETSQLIAQQKDTSAREVEKQRQDAERAAKEQLDLQEKLKAEYANEDAKRTIEHQNKLKEIAKVNNAKLQRELITQENARFKNANEKAQLEYDVKFQKATEWQQTEEERIKNNAELERRETRLTVGLHKDLVTARINEINAKEQAALQQARKGFEDELASINSYKTSAVDKIRADFGKKIAANDSRTDIKPEQVATLHQAMTGQMNNEIYFARKSVADPYDSMMAEFNGTSELQNLQNQLDQRLEIIKAYEKEHTNVADEAAKARKLINDDFVNNQKAILVGGYEQTFGAMASIVSAFGGQQSRAYHVLANIEKGYALHKAWLKSKSAILDAYADTSGSVWAKAAAAAKAAMDTGFMTAAISAIQPKGFMDGGYTGNIPTNARAGYVHGQEYVFDAPSTKAIGVKNLDRIRKGEGIGGDTNVNVNVTVNSDGTSSVESQQQLGKNMGDAVNAAIQRALLKERRQGGLLAGGR